MNDEPWNVDKFLKKRECDIHDFYAGNTIDLDHIPQRQIWICKNCPAVRLLPIGEKPHE